MSKVWCYYSFSEWQISSSDLDAGLRIEELPVFFYYSSMGAVEGGDSILNDKETYDENCPGRIILSWILSLFQLCWLNLDDKMIKSYNLKYKWMGWGGNLTHSLIYSFTDNLKARDANASKNPPVSLYFFSEGGGEAHRMLH